MLGTRLSRKVNQEMSLRSWITSFAVTSCLVWFVVGCQEGPTPEERVRQSAGQSLSAGSRTDAPVPENGETDSTADPSLADLLLSDDDRRMLQSRAREDVPAGELPVIDEEGLAAAGIRKLESRYLTIYTDLESTLAIDEIPGVFDRAVLQWADYFEVSSEKYEDWKVVGYLINAKDRFERLGLLPGDLPPFQHGYQRGRELWIYEQPSDYYRRHLVFHEGVHAFMHQVVGGVGAPWYQEGMAELLATHLWQHRQLKVGYFPKAREEVPYWGRIKIIQKDYAASEALHMIDVLRMEAQNHRDVRGYAWSWAAAAFLDGHPVYRVGFRQLKEDVADSSALFSRDFENRYSARWRDLEEEWQSFVVNIDYGFDLIRNSIQFAPGVPLPEGGRSAVVTANRGWQSSGIQLQAGKRYKVVSKGRFQLQKSPQPWWSEPGGVTIQYNQGYPLGMLMAAYRTSQSDPEVDISGFVRPIPVGLNRQLSPKQTGTLYLRINDAANQIVDNVGQVTVKVVESQPNSTEGPSTSDEQQP